MGGRDGALVRVFSPFPLCRSHWNELPRFRILDRGNEKSADVCQSVASRPDILFATGSSHSLRQHPRHWKRTSSGFTPKAIARKENELKEDDQSLKAIPAIKHRQEQTQKWDPLRRSPQEKGHCEVGLGGGVRRERIRYMIIWSISVEPLGTYSTTGCASIARNSSHI